MKRRRIPYSSKELTFIKANAHLPRRALHADFVKIFGRADVSVDNIGSLCTRNGWTNRKARKPLSLSQSELDFIKEHKSLPRRETHKLFCEAFDRSDISIKALQSIYTRNAWLSGRGPRRGPIPYSEEQLSWIKSNCTLTRPKLHMGFVERFNRQDVSVDDLKSLCSRKGWKTGRDGKIKKGNVPPNKGKKGHSVPGSEATQFKKGQKPVNAKPIGYERICSKNGYVLIKVARPNPYTGAKSRIMPKHRYLWEEKNGPIPKGHVLRHMDGNILNTDPKNWICVSLGVNARLNVSGFNNAPSDLKKTLLAQALLADKIGEHRPSPVQKMRQKGTLKKYSKKAKPADSLRELIEEESFNFDVTRFVREIDEAIASAWKGQALDSDWIVPLPFLPTELGPNPIHIDWKRLRRRPDLRNRIKQLKL